jgi:hypothetical protein
MASLVDVSHGPGLLGMKRPIAVDICPSTTPPLSACPTASDLTDTTDALVPSRCERRLGSSPICRGAATSALN